MNLVFNSQCRAQSFVAMTKSLVVLIFYIGLIEFFWNVLILSLNFFNV